MRLGLLLGALRNDPALFVVLGCARADELAILIVSANEFLGLLSVFVYNFGLIVGSVVIFLGGCFFGYLTYRP